MLFVNFVYGHAIEITMGLISYANMSSDFSWRGIDSDCSDIFQDFKICSKVL